MVNFKFDATADIIDVRGVIERFEELESALEEKHEAGQFTSEFDGWIDSSRDNSDPIHAAFGADGAEVQSMIEEFYKLRELLADIRGEGGDEQWRGDWYPVTLIREAYFTEYAQELAEDCGMVDSSAQWPMRCIDWNQAASELRMDYTSCEIAGVTYFYR